MENKTTKEKAVKFVIGLLTTLAITLASKFLTAILTSASVSDALNRVFELYPFLLPIFTGSISAGYFAQKWTGGKG